MPKLHRYRHNLSYDHKTSFDMGELIPIGAIDVLPGDTFNAAYSAMCRVTPLAKPVMHNCEVRIHNWFVPNRILWPEWEEFIVGNEPGHTYPTVTPSGAGMVLDYMGAEVVAGGEYDALPVKAYNLIYNEFYRDQDLMAERTENDMSIARIAWGRDYFTTARPEPQQGDSIEVGFSQGSVPVLGIGFETAMQSTDLAQDEGVREQPLGSSKVYSRSKVTTQGPPSIYVEAWDTTGGSPRPNVRADLSAATGGIDINDLRRSIALQRIAEARSFAGSRYADFLRWYGVNPRDGRLDRPEYLGGGKSHIAFSEVLSTAEGANTNVGDLYGHGISGVRQRRIRKMFEEHGWFISLLSVRPRGVYVQGVPRRFLRREPTDFWHRELELLPWQEISARELWAAASQETVFGYTPRYDEYREVSSYVSSTLRSGGTELDWHLGRDFQVEPVLNEDFVDCHPSERIYLDASQKHLVASIHANILAKRTVAQTARMGNYAGL